MKKKSMIIFGPSDWWTMNPSSGTHIAIQFSKTHKVLYINPISTDIGGTIESAGLSSNFIKKVFRKLKSFLKLVRKADENLYVCSPVFLPVQGNWVIDRLNNLAIRIQIGMIFLFLGMRKKSLWVENNRAADFISFFRWKLVIYQVSDFFIEDGYTKNKAKLKIRDAYASQKSDLIICVSKELQEWKKKDFENVYYLPHGVDFEKYESARLHKKKFKGLDHINKPIIGYFGTLTDSNDIDILDYCAEKLTDYHFVFAGEITQGDYSVLQKKENTTFLGHVPYENIANLCASFEVGLLPWRMCRWIECCNPLKLFEYMACGLKVVSVPINEIIHNYSELVSIGRSKEEFCEKIIWEIKNDTKDRMDKRIKTAKENSWSSHLQYLLKIMEETYYTKK